MSLLSFKEFLDFSNDVDKELYETILVLKEAHPSIKNHATIQRLLNDKAAKISTSELNRVLRAILQRSVSVAHAFPQTENSDRFLLLAEQNVLSISASILSAAVSSRLQNSIDRLSNIAKGTSLRK